MLAIIYEPLSGQQSTIGWLTARAVIIYTGNEGCAITDNSVGNVY